MSLPKKNLFPLMESKFLTTFLRPNRLPPPTVCDYMLNILIIFFFVSSNLKNCKNNFQLCHMNFSSELPRIHIFCLLIEIFNKREIKHYLSRESWRLTFNVIHSEFYRRVHLTLALIEWQSHVEKNCTFISNSFMNIPFVAK